MTVLRPTTGLVLVLSQLPTSGARSANMSLGSYLGTTPFLKKNFEFVKYTVHCSNSLTMSADCIQQQHHQSCCSVGVALTIVIYTGSKLTIGSNSPNDLCNLLFLGTEHNCQQYLSVWQHGRHSFWSIATFFLGFLFLLTSFHIELFQAAPVKVLTSQTGPLMVKSWKDEKLLT